MTVGEFVAKADSLQRRGMLALFSSDLRLLKAEAKRDLDAFAPQLFTRTPPACPPKQGDKFNFTFTVDELLRFYRSIPPARRGISASEAFGEFMAAKYPCRRRAG